MNKKQIIMVGILLFIFFILAALGIYQCPIKYIFGLSCPICGLTRAIIQALKLNFLESFHYHMLWPIIVIGIILYILYKFKKISISKKTLFIILYIFCVINLIYYFYRLFNGSDITYFDFKESLIYKIYKIVIK